MYLSKYCQQIITETLVISVFGEMCDKVTSLALGVCLASKGASNLIKSLQLSPSSSENIEYYFIKSIANSQIHGLSRLLKSSAIHLHMEMHTVSLLRKPI